MATSTPVASNPMPRLAFPALVLANLILPLGPVLVRMSDVGPVAAAFWRLAIALPVLVLLALPGLRRVRPTRREWSALMWAGIVFAIDLGAWHMGILYTKVANATLFGNMSGLFLPAWALLVLRQRPTGPQAAALALATAGALVLMGGSYELSARNLRGDLLCLIAGLSYTVYLLIVQKARGRLNGWTVLAGSSIASTPVLLLCAWALGEAILPRDWTPLLLLALSSQLVGQGLLTYAVGWFSPMILGLSLLLQPAVSVVLGWLMFGEWLSPAELFGASAVAAALVLVRLPARA